MLYNIGTYANYLRHTLTDIVQVRVYAFDVAPGIGSLGFRLRGRPDGELVAWVFVWVVVLIVSRVVFGRICGHWWIIGQTDLGQVCLSGNVRPAGAETAGPGRIRRLHDSTGFRTPGAEPVSVIKSARHEYV